MGIGNVAGIVRLHAEERPDQVAIVYGDREVTWRELDERSSRLANALLAAGVSANDRIARIEKNAPDYFELAFAASKVNAVLVDVNWRLAPAEMRQIVDDAGAKVLFVGDEFAPHLEKIEAELATVERTILLGAGDATHESIDAFAGGQPADDPGTDGSAQDICLQLYTSGTTGLPKGVMLSNENLFTFIDEVPPT
jgi:long-chain acyl-CoA synthetase